MSEPRNAVASPFIAVGPDGVAQIPLAAIFEHASIAFAIFDPLTRRLVEMNRSMADILGRSDLETESFTFEALFPPQESPHVTTLWRKVIQGTITTGSLETFIIGSRGVNPARVTIRQLRTHAGHGPVVVLMEDLRPLHDTVERATLSSERIRLVAAATRKMTEAGLEFRPAAQAVATLTATSLGDGCGVYVVSEDGAWLEPVALHHHDPRVVAEVQALERDGRFPADEGLIGRVLATKRTLYLPSVDLELLVASAPSRMRGFLERRAPRSMIFAPLLVNGAAIGVLYLSRERSDPYTLEDKDLAEEIAAMAAATLNNARLHQALLRHEKELEQKVAERTKALRETNASLEAFASTAAHDLRSPLGVIGACAETLLMGRGEVTEEDVRESALRIARNAKAMTDLIAELLGFSRALNVPLRREEVDLGKVAVAVLDDLAAADPDHRPTVKVDGPLFASCDAGLLRVALGNLLANAWKFTKGSPSPAIKVGRTAHDDAPPIFFVHDNGAGFDPAKVEKMFQPFQRFHDALRFPGTGIGLATVRRVVERHGGRIWAESRPGEGATFFFVLGPDREGAEAALSGPRP